MERWVWDKIECTRDEMLREWEKYAALAGNIGCEKSYIRCCAAECKMHWEELAKSIPEKKDVVSTAIPEERYENLQKLCTKLRERVRTQNQMAYEVLEVLKGKYQRQETTLDYIHNALQKEVVLLREQLFRSRHRHGESEFSAEDFSLVDFVRFAENNVVETAKAMKDFLQDNKTFDTEVSLTLQEEGSRGREAEWRDRLERERESHGKELRSTMVQLEAAKTKLHMRSSELSTLRSIHENDAKRMLAQVEELTAANSDLDSQLKTITKALQTSQLLQDTAISKRKPSVSGDEPAQPPTPTNDVEGLQHLLEGVQGECKQNEVLAGIKLQELNLKTQTLFKSFEDSRKKEVKELMGQNDELFQKCCSMRNELDVQRDLHAAAQLEVQVATKEECARMFSKQAQRYETAAKDRRALEDRIEALVLKSCESQANEATLEQERTRLTRTLQEKNTLIDMLCKESESLKQTLASRPAITEAPPPPPIDASQDTPIHTLERSDSLLHEHDNLKAEFKNRKRELDASQIRCLALEEEKAALSSALEESRAREMQKGDRIEKITAELERGQREHATLQHRATKLEDDLRTATEGFSSRRTELEAEVTSLQDKVTKLLDLSPATSSDTSTAERTEHVSRLLSSLKTLPAGEMDHKLAVLRHQDEVAALKKDSTTLQERLTESEARCAELEAGYKGVSLEDASVQADVPDDSSTDVVITNLETLGEEKDKEIADLIARNHNLEAQREGTEQALLSEQALRDVETTHLHTHIEMTHRMHIQQSHHLFTEWEEAARETTILSEEIDSHPLSLVHEFILSKSGIETAVRTRRPVRKIENCEKDELVSDAMDRWQKKVTQAQVYDNVFEVIDRSMQTILKCVDSDRRPSTAEIQDKRRRSTALIKAPPLNEYQPRTDSLFEDSMHYSTPFDDYNAPFDSTPRHPDQGGTRSILKKKQKETPERRLSSIVPSPEMEAPQPPPLAKPKRASVKEILMGSFSSKTGSGGGSVIVTSVVDRNKVNVAKRGSGSDGGVAAGVGVSCVEGASSQQFNMDTVPVLPTPPLRKPGNVPAVAIKHAARKKERFNPKRPSEQWDIEELEDVVQAF